MTPNGVITLMDLKTFLSPKTGQERDEFAAKCLTSKGHLQNIMYGLKPCAPGLAVLIERHSKRAVTRQELCDDWQAIWPELVKREKKAVA